MEVTKYFRSELFTKKPLKSSKHLTNSSDFARQTCVTSNKIKIKSVPPVPDDLFVRIKKMEPNSSKNMKPPKQIPKIKRNPDRNSRPTSLDEKASSNAKKSKPNNDVKSEVNPAITLTNQFEGLTDNETDDNMSIASDASTHQSIASHRSKASHHSTAKTKKLSAPKPIVVPDISHDVIKNSILTANTQSKPTIQKYQNGYKIFVSSAADKLTIKTQLESHKIKFYTYSEPENRHFIVELSKFYKTDPKELLEILKAQEIPAVNVSLFNRSNTNPIYLVHFTKNTIKLDELNYKHKVVDYHKVQWNLLDRSLKKPTQCRRCQRFGHSASNCNLDYRCIKCLLKHEPGQCARKTTTEGAPSCVNCNTEGHPSNSRTCPMYKKYASLIPITKPADKRPRNFTSAPAPWHQAPHQSPHDTPHVDNSNFPSLPSQTHNYSQHNVNVSRDSRPALNNPRIIQNESSHNEPQDFFRQLNDLQNEFANIPEIQETFQYIRVLISKLRATNNHHERACLLLNFQVPKCV